MNFEEEEEKNLINIKAQLLKHNVYNIIPKFKVY